MLYLSGYQNLSYQSKDQRGRASIYAISGLEVAPYSLHRRIDLPQEAGIQDVFRHLVNDSERTAAIAAEIENAFSQGRKVLALTERTEHLDAILAALAEKIPLIFVLHGRMSKKQRAIMITELKGCPTYSRSWISRLRSEHLVVTGLGKNDDPKCYKTAIIVL